MPKKICNQINCHTLIPMSERYCAAHKREVVKETNKSYDKYNRNKEHTKFYNSTEWRELRRVVLEHSGGLCVKCMEFDIVTKANVVDHIIPIEKDYTKRLDITNLQPLCHACHNKKTADDEVLYGRGA